MGSKLLINSSICAEEDDQLSESLWRGHQNTWKISFEDFQL